MVCKASLYTESIIITIPLLALHCYKAEHSVDVYHPTKTGSNSVSIIDTAILVTNCLKENVYCVHFNSIIVYFILR